MDEQKLKKDFLTYLYKNKIRYIGRDAIGLHGFENEPENISNDDVIYINNGKKFNLEHVDELFCDIDKYKVLDICKELRIVDWENLPSDTKVFVRNSDNENWDARYFWYHRDDFCTHPYICYANGQSSFTTNGEPEGWKYCKLAEDNK